MLYTATTATNKILKMNKRLRILQGGSSAGKTIGILLYLIDQAQTRKNILISVVSETIPHLKRGAIRDFLSIMKEHNYYKDASWNKTDYIYTFETDSKIEFFSADTSDKVRGPRRDILFINECNNVSYETYTQLAIRTNEYIFLDFNPVSEFWVHTEIIPTLEHDFAILTYKDNEALPQSIVSEIESRRKNKYFWSVYGEGQIGEVEGKIYKDWQIVDLVPHEARLERYGLDFGYSNDPTAIDAIYKYNGGYIIDQIAHKKGLSNKQIADILLNQPQALVIADSAEPKSIDEIMSYGVNILPSLKGQGSILKGIQFVQNQRISITKRSIDTIKEYRNYLWQTDKEGRIINVPDVGFDHHMDGIRYAINSLDVKEEEVDVLDEQLFNEAGFY
jgi:phage terminase large subunit